MAYSDQELNFKETDRTVKNSFYFYTLIYGSPDPRPANDPLPNPPLTGSITTHMFVNTHIVSHTRHDRRNSLTKYRL